MKQISGFFGCLILAAGIFIGGCAKKPRAFASLKDSNTARQLKQFVAEKEAQANTATNALPPEFHNFFAAANRGDWLAVSNSFSELSRYNNRFAPGPLHNSFFESIRNFISEWMEKAGWHRAPEPALRGTYWEAAKEIYGAFKQFVAGDEKYSAEFGRDIIDSIPAGSIYFGGTDPGRFIVTAMCRSQIKADPFFTLTQNALADSSYLDYLRSMYGNKIYIPTPADSQTAFEDYTHDVARRSQHDADFPGEAKQLLPGEDVHISGGRVQVSGQVAVMQINGLLVKKIFDENPSNEVYVEESFPLNWMYPQLEPHGLIFKLDGQPMTKLPDAIVQQDHDYWTKYVEPMIGDWLTDDTSVAEVASFAEKTFGRHDFSGFKGDPEFVENAYAHKMFSKLRSSIAGLYMWRANHAADAADKERMTSEADFAFRQAWALCPYSPEAVYRYVNFLEEQNRSTDALLVAETAAKMPEMKGRDGDTLRTLVTELGNPNIKVK